MARLASLWRPPHRVAARLMASTSGRLWRTRRAALEAIALSEERARRAQTLADGSQQFAEDGLDVPGVLDAVARLTGEVLGDLSIVRLLADDRQRLLPGSAWHSDPDALSQARAALASEAEGQVLGMSRQVLETGRSLRASEVTQDIRTTISPVHHDYIERH
ncbi:MAG: hypothetical protein ACRD1H_08325, partial [Vicinamibacterales bacterium]